MEIVEIFNEIRKDLDALDQQREELIQINRKIVRQCSEAIRAIHREEYEQATSAVSVIEADLASANKKLVIPNDEGSESEEGSSSNTGSLFVAYQEYIEAKTLLFFVLKKPFPGPKEFHDIPLVSWILGIADTIGELRRYCLDRLRKDDFDEAERALSLMDELDTGLMTLDYPKGLIPGVRRKSDVSRAILEKTRGDLTSSISRNRLLIKLLDFEPKLDKLKNNQ